MARDRSPIGKQSRREGVALHPKAHKIMAKRNYGPGDHGPSFRTGKLTQYGKQLREKQKVKRMYGLLEKQFKRLINEADNMSGLTGENLLQLLERRLDNTVYRLKLANSRRAARQLVSHGHIEVNGQRVTIPSLRVSKGDEIKVRDKSSKNTYFQSIKEELKEDLPEVSWLSLDASKFEAKVTGTPQRDEAEPDINEQLIIEFYSR